MTRTAITNDPDWPEPRDRVVDLVTDDMVDIAYSVLYPVESWPDSLVATAKRRVRTALETALFPAE